MRKLQPRSKIEVPAHPRFKGFEAFAAWEIEPEIAEREGDRRRAVRRATNVAIAVALIVTAAAALAIFGDVDLAVPITLAVVAIFYGLFAAMKPLTSHSAGLGHFLVRKTCQHLGLRHTGEAAFPAFGSFLHEGLVPSYAKHSFEDGIECDDPDLRFRLAEVSMTDSSEWDSIEDHVSGWRGLLLELAAPLPFAGDTLVAPKRTLVAGLIKKRPGDPVELRWGGLESEFVVRTTDPDEARAILTERLMKRLAELARPLGCTLPALALIRGSVLLAIESSDDRFQAGSVFTPIELAEQLNPILAEFALVLEIAETLRDALAVRVGRAR